MAEESSTDSTQIPQLVSEISSLTVNAPNQAFPSSSTPGFRISQEEIDQRFQIVRSIGEECIQEDELRNLLSKKASPICYDGFEPSGGRILFLSGKTSLRR